ncbi:MAG: hypothetical protein H8E63_08065 [Proteobacteria bacterium]|nr:hypothetical protein [Pseudomonadota bacterium]
MTGRVLPQVLKAVGISVPVTLIWLEWGRAAYGSLFATLSIPIFGFLGLPEVLPEGTRDRFIGYLPFLIMMVVTPRMSHVRRFAGIVIGFVAIFFLQMFFVYMSHRAGVIGGQMNAQDVYVAMLPVLLLCDAFPFVLWIVFAKDFVREITAKVFENAGQ